MQALVDLAVGAGRMHMHPPQRGRVAHGLVVACGLGRDLELGRGARDVAGYEGHLRITRLAVFRVAQDEARARSGQCLAQGGRFGGRAQNANSLRLRHGRSIGAGFELADQRRPIVVFLPDEGRELPGRAAHRLGPFIEHLRL
ncbi:hypothetical protein G6F35_015689 [Rhizopus arrhizus]|nr:hypothetical protein G6F35_015689 [Rhizopus arrhizus]